MSRDSSHTHLHLHSARHADLFEDFCRPPSSANLATTQSGPHQVASQLNAGMPSTNTTTTANTADPSMTQLPGHFLPFEEIHLPPHLQPANPEDEDDVVPDMHAAFGICWALGLGTGAGDGTEGDGRGVAREPEWRDLGLERLVEAGPAGEKGLVTGARKEGRKTGLLLMR